MAFSKMAEKYMRDIELSNNKIKEILKLHQKKYRDESGLFLVEGMKALEEIIESNIEIINIFSVKELNISNCKSKVSIVNENIMKKISTTDSVCEVLTIAKKREVSLDNFNKMKKIALFENISDPGNLGTIIRSAAAFNVDGIILFGNCVELYSPKVIRSSTGNFFKTPILQIKNISELKKISKNYTVVATLLSKENNVSIDEIRNYEKLLVMFGSEANGLTKDLVSISDKNTIIKMNKNVESLNLSVSASIIFYELFK